MTTDVLTFLKDPDATLDYGVDWSDWLAQGETITGSVWTLTAGITKYNESYGTTATTVWLQGGVSGTTYRATNHITTSEGRQDDRTLTIKVKDR